MLETVFSLLLSCPLLLLRIRGMANSFPKPLEPREEAEYIRRSAQGDLEARNELISHNLRLVAHIMKKYYARGDQDDLISIGTIGLIKAINSYDPEKSVRLATYASRCIENEILMYFRSQKKSAGDVSLSDTLDSDGEGGELSIMDVVSVEDDILDELAAQETGRRLRTYVEKLLDRREREIISLRYGLGGGAPLTQREVSERLGISRSYVSRIEKRALEKLRKRLEAEDNI
ncbi:MAG: RNA polymerase sporulation sigma factor SigK [Oscillospiraceae bacterium]|nr:RNA polymerase sporulation sigma factor SigK [Oscillospiraceae bacterium]